MYFAHHLRDDGLRHGGVPNRDEGVAALGRGAGALGAEAAVGLGLEHHLVQFSEGLKVAADVGGGEPPVRAQAADE